MQDSLNMSIENTNDTHDISNSFRKPVFTVKFVILYYTDTH